MCNNLADVFVEKLIGKIPDVCLKAVRDQFVIFMQDYDITEKCTDVVPYEYATPQELTIYLAESKIEGRSVQTISGYKLILENFLLKLRKPLAEITGNDVLIYLATYKEERQITDASLDHIRIVITTFLEWCVTNEYLQRNPAKKVKAIKYQKEKESALTDFQVEAIRANCKTQRDLAMIDFMLSTGCRVSEILPIRINDIDRQNWEVEIIGKGNKKRTVYINGKAAHSLETYLSGRGFESELLFASRRLPHGKIKKEAVEKTLRKIGTDAGVVGLHPHRLRRTCATNALRRGMDITLVQQMLGHENIETTMRYININTEDLANSHRRYVA